MIVYETSKWFLVIELRNKTSGLLTLQPSQPLLRILNLSYSRISVFPEGEEFLVML
ncbi:MAG: hypothetical protein GTO16_05490 [Candidatus Aminicenantes bacterium]|nr:hypothetical protein [Candidatus Aminicenantes bacterium]